MSREWTNLTFVDSKKKALAELDRLRLLKSDAVAVDSEFDFKDDEVVIWSYSSRKGERVVVLGEFATSVYGEWLEDPGVPKVYSGFKADARSFRKKGIDLARSFHADTVVTGWSVDEHQYNYGLKKRSARDLGWRRQEYSDLFAYVPTGKTKKVVLTPKQLMGIEPLPDEALELKTAADWMADFIEYSGDDADGTKRLYSKDRRALEEVGYWDTYLQLDQPFTLVLMNCEDRGILIDQEKMSWIATQAGICSRRAEQCFRSRTGAAGRAVNLNAHPQMRKLLIEELGWKPFEDLLTEKAEDPQVGKEALKRWAQLGHVEAAVLLERNANDKLVRDIRSLREGLSPDGRIRTDYNQIGTDTGRISSRKWKERRVFQVQLKTKVKEVEKQVEVGANLQNVVGMGEKDQFGLKDAFVAPKEGQLNAAGEVCREDYDLVVGDFSGFELCMAIHWIHKIGIKKSSMLDVMRAYKNPSAVHAYTAIEMFGLATTMAEWEGVKKKWPDKYKLSKNCYHPDTQALTRSGWKRIGDLSMEDEVAQAHPEDGGRTHLSWTKPLDLQRFKSKHDHLVHLKSEGIDLRVTPDHRMLAFKGDMTPVVVTPDEFGKQKLWLNAAPLPGSRIEDDATMLRLAVALQADGSITKEGHVTFGFTKGRKIRRLSDLLDKAGVKYTCSVQGTHQVTTFYVNREEAKPFRRLLTEDKKLPWWWLDLQLAYRSIVLDEVRHWNGAERSGRAFVYLTAERENAEVLQALATITGHKTRLVQRPNGRPDSGWRPLWWLTIRNRSTSAKTVGLATEHIPYDGDVVCLSVPSTFVVVRDGGVPVISGNCNFNLLYKGSPWMLALLRDQNPTIDEVLEENQALYDGWYRLYPEITRYQDFMIDHGHRYGWVPTIGGRRAHVAAGLASIDKKEVAHWERKCTNAPCQGSAANITKMAMVLIERDPELRRLGYLQTFQVHDEIGGECPRSTSARALERKIELMKQAYRDELAFEMAVEGKCAPTWLKAK